MVDWFVSRITHKLLNRFSAELGWRIGLSMEFILTFFTIVRKGIFLLTFSSIYQGTNQACLGGWYL